MVVINDEFNGCGMQMRAERERLGYTREQVAERAHITPRYLAAIELGTKIPKADVMVRIIRSMGASANSVIYSPQQETNNECERLAHLFLQCTLKSANSLLPLLIQFSMSISGRTHRRQRCNCIYFMQKGKRALLRVGEQCPFSAGIDPWFHYACPLAASHPMSTLH